MRESMGAIIGSMQAWGEGRLEDFMVEAGFPVAD